MTIRSSAPPSSTPCRTRSANRPVDFRCIPPGYNRSDEQPDQLAAQPVLVPLRAVDDGGAGRRLRSPRARARTRPRRDPRGPVRPEPADAPADEPPAGPPRDRARDRRRHDRGYAPLARAGLTELEPDAAFARPRERRSPDRDVPGRDPVRLEDDDVVVRVPARRLAGHDLLQLVHLEPVEHARRDGLDQVARLLLGLLEGVAADEARALEHDVVELAGAPIVRADRADERAQAEPFAAQHRVLRGRGRHDDVLPARLVRALGRLGAHALAE